LKTAIYSKQAALYILHLPRAGSAIVGIDRFVSWPDVVQGD